MVKDDFFFEGIFNGELNTKGLSDSNLCLGSGYTYSEGKPTFITPSHTLEGLFLIKNAEKYFVSNSNVIAYSLANLTPSHNAVKKGWRIKYGLKQVPQVIEKSGDIEITKISFYNFSVIDYELVLIDKSEEPDFSDFNEYYSYLLNQGMKLMSNYEELNGKPIDVVSTVSTGFDSVACLGIAKQLGCKYALTLRSGRGNVKDEGSDIAKAININCKIYSRPFSEDSLISRIAIDYLSLDKCSEFVAAGTLAEDVCYLPFEDSINDTLLLTGFQGDRVWSKTLTPTSYLDRGDVSGSSMGEFRLRAGFIHWPLPFIGCRKNELLLKITLSDEMKPYTTESNYNKPISIRIADIAKIPRSLYGVRKRLLVYYLMKRLAHYPLQFIHNK